MVEVAERDINQALRVILSRREMECALNILERFKDKKTITLCIKYDIPEFAGAQVYYVVRMLVILGLIQYKKYVGKVKITCANKEQVDSIINNKQTLSTKSEIKDIHKLMSIVQCEAIEILSGYLLDTTTEINIRKFCRENFFDARILAKVFKYLEIANVLEVKSTHTKVTVITVLNEKVLMKIVDKTIERLEE